MRIRFALVVSALLAAVLHLSSGSVFSHEIGTTSIRVHVDADHRWSFEMTTAPILLINRLELEAGQSAGRDLTVEEARSRLGSLLPVLDRHLALRFDGAKASTALSIKDLQIPSDVTLPAFVVLRGSGTVPADAMGVTWEYDLVFSTYAVVFSDDASPDSQTQWLEGDERSAPFALAGSAPRQGLASAILQYLALGYLHILPEGLDHILFVLGIFLLTTKRGPVLIQVTAFTVAHSVTLGLTMYGVVSLPSRIVEPLIALSVAYVAIENILTPKLSPWRPVVVFGFGLLHGMGFAGALNDLHLPRSEIIPALISFNVGIEAAQLTIIALAYLGFARWFRERPWYRGRFVIPASAAIAATGLFWTVERLLAL